MTRILLAAPWTALLVAGLLPWLNTSSTPKEESAANSVQQNNCEWIVCPMPTPEETEDRSKRRDQFAALQDQLTTELIAGRLTVDALVDRVLSYCLVSYPEHLENINLNEQGSSLREKLGLNVGSMCAVPGPLCHRPDFAAIRQRIEASLREFQCNEEAYHRSQPGASLVVR